MSSSTLRTLCLGTLVFALSAGCGGGDNSVLLTLKGLPSRATQLALRATLDQKPLTDSAMTTTPLALPLPDNQLGLTLPAAGHLTLDIQALDGDLCTHGTSRPELEVTPGVLSFEASIGPVSPRKCGNLAACADGVGCPVPSLGIGSSIRSIWTIAPNDIWAVGTASTVLHYDGTSWTTTPPASLPVPNPTQWNSVWASASNDVWVVGAAGRVIHYDGSKWTASPIGALRSLQSISGISAQNIWTVGLSAGGTTTGEFWHWNGTAWSAVTPFAKGDLNAVLAVDPNFIVVGGGDSGFNGVLWVMDNKNAFTNYSAAAPVTVNALWASSVSRVIAVGAVSEILIFDGTMWNLALNEVKDDFRSVTNDGKYTYIVGAKNAVLRSSDLTLKTLMPVSGLPAADYWALRLANNGLAWIGGDSGSLGYLDTRP